MLRLSDEQIEHARSVDLLAYLQAREPQSLRKCGANEYCLAEHDSFKISNGKWFWHSRQFGGNSALSFLVQVRGVPFRAAVESLTNRAIFPYCGEKSLPKMNSPPKIPKPFTLPKANKNNDRAVAYLRRRGIGKGIINRCIEAGILYESTRHNCVFVGKDGEIPKFASERGTEDGLKRDISGSDKRFSFNLQPETSAGSRVIAVFESPVDALAHHGIHEMGQTGWDGYRLSLGGVGSLALFGFLERHSLIACVSLCLDNDKAGKEAAGRIVRELLGDKRFSQIKITVAPPPNGIKDYADALQEVQKKNTEKSEPDRRKSADYLF